MNVIYTTYGIASNKFLTYSCLAKMNEDEEIIKLDPKQAAPADDRVTRLEQFQKSRTNKSADS